MKRVCISDGIMVLVVVASAVSGDVEDDDSINKDDDATPFDLVFVVGWSTRRMILLMPLFGEENPSATEDNNDAAATQIAEMERGGMVCMLMIQSDTIYKPRLKWNRRKIVC